MFHTSIIELSRRNLSHNLEFLRARLNANVLHSSVIKGNAYGHGIANFTPVAQELGVEHFSVFSAGEALATVDNLVEPATVMIMGYIDDVELAWAVENDVEFYVFDVGRLEAAKYAAKKVGKQARVHLEIETGMNRTGLELDELNQAVEMIRGNGDTIHVAGVCTHFAGAESTANYWRVQKQIKRFRQAIARLRRMGFNQFRAHAASSAGTFSYPTTQYDMVRSGIIQYGYWPSRETLMHYLLENGIEEGPVYGDPLKRVMRWKSRVMHVKTVKAGEYIGYGISYMTSRTTDVASVPVGYWHGFARALSNLGHVLIHGQRLPVIGTVNMNMILVDITDLTGVQPGDEVVVIGTQGEQEISVSSFAEASQYLNYEVLVRLPSEIPRVWVD